MLNLRMFLKKRLRNLKGLNLIGGSLKPFLKEGDLLFLDVGNRKINNYDLVSFLKGDELITHVARLKGGELFLMPLNGSYRDGPVNMDSVIGKVLWVKKGKIFLPFLPFKFLIFFYFKIKGIK